mmetsp:Transcript_51681/g.66202  ORF Transcript_51681/g.66202 Transcript_51681/m.66202 type:complete len:889 (+) Transcript_51681:87-2753(+)
MKWSWLLTSLVFCQSIGLGNTFSLRNIQLRGVPRKAKTISERPFSNRKPPHILISGGPASGKGTQCEYIVKDYGLVHISTGDLLREAVKNESPIGLQVKEFMDRGHLVPDEIVIDLVKEKLQSEECQQKGWLLDGFPRTLEQAYALTALGAKPDAYIYLHVPDPVLIKRVTGRRTDPVTGYTYHTEYDPPPSQKVADRCYIRTDDTQDAIRVRLARFHGTMSHVKEYYRDILTEVDGSGRKKEVYNMLSKIVENTVDKAKGVFVEKQTIPIPGMKMGTSGLRKKVSDIIKNPDFLPNFIQSIFDALPPTEVKGGTLLLGGDGRYYNKKAIQIIIRIAIANGVHEIWCAQNGLLSTPACSAILRERKRKDILFKQESDGTIPNQHDRPFGSILLTASHNPGGPNGDFGIKFNTRDGAPANEEITNKIYEESCSIKKYFIVNDDNENGNNKDGNKDIDLNVPINTEYKIGHSKVTIIDPLEDYIEILKECFDFKKINQFIKRPDFNMVIDCMNGVGGVGAKKILGELLEIPSSSFIRCEPKEDFGGTHPDPNLKYADQLLKIMGISETGEPIIINNNKNNDGAHDDANDDDENGNDHLIPPFGCALDGDADRNMILGKQCFVSPSDSLAIIAANGKKAIPQFKVGILGLARSMPTSKALDVVARKHLEGFQFETPTGWKYFSGLMDLDDGEYSPFLCGEESFGTGASHIREKDGLWAVLAWLSILAYHNPDPTKPLVGVQDIRDNHWKEYGRHYYCRYDYDGLTMETATKVMETIRERMAEHGEKRGLTYGGLKLYNIEEFIYIDPTDNNKLSENHGMILDFNSGERAVFRISGTSSDSVTLRLYLENYQIRPNMLFRETSDMMKQVATAALEASRLIEITGMTSPSVIT